MIIWLRSSLSKSLDCLFIKSLFWWYCFCLLSYMESLLLRAHLVCPSTIQYFVFIEFVFLFIFGKNLGLFICDILLILARRSSIHRFILNVQPSFLLLMIRSLTLHSFLAWDVSITVIAAA